MLVGGIVAFFDSFRLNDPCLPIMIAGKYGISAADFMDGYIDLHRYEVVSIYRDKAIKFENQNLQDYLLYYVFFKEKWISISDIIYDTFPQYRKRMVFSFGTLINLFYTPDHFTYMKTEVQTAWNQIKSTEPENILQFILTFHTIIPDESLLYVKKEIENLPVFQNDLLEYDFEKHKNSHEIKSDLLKILSSFKDTDFFSDAIQLALRFFEKSTENPMDIYFLLTDEWGIDCLSCRNQYRSEKILIEAILEYYEHNKSVLSAFCLLFYAESLIKIKFSDVAENRNNTIAYCQFGVCSCDEVYAIRSLSLQSLVLLLDFEPVHNQAVMALLSYPLHGEAESDQVIFAHDIDAFTKFFPLMHTKNELERCEILNHFEKVCRNNGIEWPHELPRSCENNIYRIFTVLSESYLMVQKSHEEPELHRKQSIEKLSGETTLSEFDSLWTMLQRREECMNKENAWDLKQGIDQLFSALAAQDLDKCVKCCNSYMYHGTPYWSGSSIIINELMNGLGYKETENLIVSQNFTLKYQWLNLLHNFIPDEDITEDVCEMFTNWICHSPDGKNYNITPETALRITRKFPEFLKEYMQELNSLGNTKPVYIFSFMFGLERDRGENLSQIVEYFKDDLEILENAYINAIQGHDFYDLDGQLLDQLYNVDSQFLTKFLTEIARKNTYRDYWPQLDCFWKRSDFLKIVSNTIDHLKDEDVHPFQKNIKIARSLLHANSSSIGEVPERDIWLEYYIKTNSENQKAMKFLFNVLSDLPKDQLRKAVVCFCTHNKNFEAFRNLSIHPHSWSWSGSAIPMIESEISYLESLKDDLQGFDYIDHRCRITEIIHAYNQWKEQELLNEFLEGD